MVPYAVIFMGGSVTISISVHHYSTQATTLSREEDCSKRAAILSGNQSANVHLTEDCLMDRQLKVCHVIFYEPFIVIICYHSAKDTMVKEYLVKTTVRIYHAYVHENDVVIICYCKGTAT